MQGQWNANQVMAWKLDCPHARVRERPLANQFQWRWLTKSNTSRLAHSLQKLRNKQVMNAQTKTKQFFMKKKPWSKANTTDFCYWQNKIIQFLLLIQQWLFPFKNSPNVDTSFRGTKKKWKTYRVSNQVNQKRACASKCLRRIQAAVVKTMQRTVNIARVLRSEASQSWPPRSHSR